MLAFLVYLHILAYLCSVHLYTFSYLYTWGTQHHQRVPRLCKYTSANSLDNNSQSERIPSEEGSRVQIGQNAMALEGGGQSVIRIIKLKNLELKLWPRILIIFCLQYCMHVSTVCILCTTFFPSPDDYSMSSRRQNSRGLDELATLFILHKDIKFSFSSFQIEFFIFPMGLFWAGRPFEHKR